MQKKLVLMCFLNLGYPAAMYAWYMHIFFWKIYQIQTLQYKQTRDLSSSNMGSLLNKVLWCLQFQEECLKTFLLVVCVCLEVFEFVNPLFMMIQG